MPFVADTGLILSFARANWLELLKDAVKTLVIPDAVYDEIVGDDPGRPGYEAVQQSTWIHQQTVRYRTILATFPKKLHTGECEAIVLVEALRAIQFQK